VQTDISFFTLYQNEFAKTRRKVNQVYQASSLYIGHTQDTPKL